MELTSPLRHLICCCYLYLDILPSCPHKCTLPSSLRMDNNSAKPVNAQPASKDMTMGMNSLHSLTLYLTFSSSAEVREHSAEEADKKQSIWGRPLRMRGGGAAKDCLMAFACFEVCKGCCDCFADIICGCCLYVLLLQIFMSTRYMLMQRNLPS